MGGTAWGALGGNWVLIGPLAAPTTWQDHGSSAIKDGGCPQSRPLQRIGIETARGQAALKPQGERGPGHRRLHCHLLEPREAVVRERFVPIARKCPMVEVLNATRLRAVASQKTFLWFRHPASHSTLSILPAHQAFLFLGAGGHGIP